MPEKYRFSGWVWILAAVIVVGFVALGFYLIQTQQRLKAVEVELGGAKEETGRARAGATQWPNHISRAASRKLAALVQARRSDAEIAHDSTG